jgi:hypothetical protein
MVSRQKIGRLLARESLGGQIMGYIGSSLASVNSGRVAQVRKERLDFEADLKHKSEKPIREWTEKLAKAQGQEIAEIKNLAILQLRGKLVSEVSPDFSTEFYVCDGHDSAADVTRKIGLAVTEFCEVGSPLPSYEDMQLLTKFVILNWEHCDTTKVSTYQKAWEYILEQFAALDKTFGAPPVPEKSAPASNSKFPEQDALIASLQSELDALPVGNSRVRENLERRIHQEQVKAEILGDDSSRAILQEISDQSGLLISSSVALQFKAYAASPVAKRRFGSDRTSVRLCFAEFTGNDSFLTPEEKSLVGNYRAIENMTADEVAAQTGRNRSYASNPHAGIRQP